MNREDIKAGDDVEVRILGWSKSILTRPVIETTPEDIHVRLDSGTTKKYPRNSKLILNHFPKNR